MYKNKTSTTKNNDGLSNALFVLSCLLKRNISYLPSYYPQRPVIPETSTRITVAFMAENSSTNEKTN